ncbi:DUF2971 domain-containing protein [Ancylobacter sp.]|uniref:DUF2971 domain-containing protein n=1 Tax=Ancylobacter sp. TaxID=1872567 RepID=UPI003C79AA8A
MVLFQSRLIIQSIGNMDTLYKYVDQNGAIKMIADCTLKYTAPHALNDPFDLFIDDLMNYDEIDIKRRRLKLYLDFIKSKPFDYFLNVHSGIDSWFLQSNIGRFSQTLNELKDHEYTDLIEGMCRDLDIKFPFNIPKQDNSIIIDPIANCGVFCATKNIRSILMWSHYAEGHKGAIVGISRDCVHQDAPLMDVIYSNSRVSFYDTVTEHTLNKINNIDSTVDKFTERALLSKSNDWSYEQEVRSVILDVNRKGNSFYLHNIDPSMIKELYIGVKSDDKFTNYITSLAKIRNQNCQIFKVGMERYSYDLNFTPI